MSASFVAHRRVEFRDTDAAGIMHFSTFFTSMEEVEHEFLRSLQSSVMVAQPDGSKLSWPRVSASCNYRAALRFEERYQVALRVRTLGRTSAGYAFRFLRGEQVCAEGELTVVHCRIHHGPPTPEPIPLELRERMMHFLEAAKG